MKHQNGFTIIELVIVVGILTIISSLGIARYRSFQDRQTVEQTARKLVSDLRLAQSKAISGDKPTISDCTTFEGYIVTFAELSYTMSASCIPEGVSPETQVTTDLPGYVNISPIPGPLKMYALGKGISSDTTINVRGTAITYPIVVTANSITLGPPQSSVTVITTPTPTVGTCPWPAGDPRCG